ncbi:MAG: 5-formyltetrahydrofolate cyclo-ligase [Acidimicrobiia bacterium]|nr:5-formyltetrahydrofolate cyclo-ligase [Acidimicrobiia bacterium]
MATKDLWRSWAAAQRWIPGQDLIRSGVEAFLGSLTDPVVLTYAAMPGEPDVVAVRGAGRLLLTRTPKTGPLTVHAATSTMETHRWGYRQPVEGSVEIDPGEIDVVLVPGALFDREGDRLGHGRGYYDRLLASCRSDVLKVGITTVNALVERLPVEPHDIPMTHLATEVGVRRIRSGGIR